MDRGFDCRITLLVTFSLCVCPMSGRVRTLPFSKFLFISWRINKRLIDVTSTRVRLGRKSNEHYSRGDESTSKERDKCWVVFDLSFFRIRTEKDFFYYYTLTEKNDTGTLSLVRTPLFLFEVTSTVMY